MVGSRARPVSRWVGRAGHLLWHGLTRGRVIVSLPLPFSLSLCLSLSLSLSLSQPHGKEGMSRPQFYRTVGLRQGSLAEEGLSYVVSPLSYLCGRAHSSQLAPLSNRKRLWGVSACRQQAARYARGTYNTQVSSSCRLASFAALFAFSCPAAPWPTITIIIILLLSSSSSSSHLEYSREDETMFKLSYCKLAGWAFCFELQQSEAVVCTRTG